MREKGEENINNTLCVLVYTLLPYPCSLIPKS